MPLPIICEICGKERPRSRHHKLAKKLGGKLTGENKADLCADCHKRVHKTFTIEQLATMRWAAVIHTIRAEL